MDTWLIDTALFKSLAPGGPQGDTLRSWIETHEDPLFLSTAFLVELKAVIDKIRGRETKRAEALQAWFDGLVTTFSDRIHPIDIHVAVRAGSLLPYRQEGLPRDRFYDVVLAPTAQIHGHGLLTRESPSSATDAEEGPMAGLVGNIALAEASAVATACLRY